MKLPLLNTREFAKIINKIGFNCKRQEGSQVFWGYVEGRATVVLNPGGEEIDRGLLNIPTDRNNYTNVLSVVYTKDITNCINIYVFWYRKIIYKKKFK